MEKFTPQESVSEYDPAIEPSESVGQPEGVESGLRSAWQKTARQVSRWLQIAVATSFIGAAVEKANAGEIRLVSKGKQEARLINREQDQGREIQLREIEDICRRNGFFVDLRGGAADITLPDGKVKKVILHLGQIHGAAPYSEMPEDQRRNTATEQREIQLLLEGAAQASGETPICLLEGVSSKEKADIYKLGDAAVESYADFGYALAQNDRDVEQAALHEISMIKKHAESVDGNDRTRATVYNNTLSEMALHMGRCLADDRLSQKQKGRVKQAIRIFEQYTNQDLLLYELGGAIQASRRGMAELGPAETVERSHRVFSRVCNDLGLTYDRNGDFYLQVSKMPMDQQNKVGDLIAKYATEKDIERGPIEQAEKSLAKEDLVVLVFGEGHDLSDVMADKYQEGKLKDTALIKINTTDFQLKMADK